MIKFIFLLFLVLDSLTTSARSSPEPPGELLWNMLRRTRTHAGFVNSGGSRYDPHKKIEDHLLSLDAREQKRALAMLSEQGLSLADKALKNHFFRSLAVLTRHHAVSREVLEGGLSTLLYHSFDLSRADRKGLEFWLATAFKSYPDFALETLTKAWEAESSSLRDAMAGPLTASAWLSVIGDESLAPDRLRRLAGAMVAREASDEFYLLVTHPNFDLNALDSNGYHLAVIAWAHSQLEILSWIQNQSDYKSTVHAVTGTSVEDLQRGERVLEASLEASHRLGKNLRSEVLNAHKTSKLTPARLEPAEEMSLARHKDNIIYQGIGETCTSCCDLVYGLHNHESMDLVDSAEGDLIHLGLCDYDSDSDDESDDQSPSCTTGARAGCGHIYCSECLGQYIDDQKGGMKPIECPQYGCSRRFSLGDLSLFMDESELTDYQDKLYKTEIMSHEGYRHCSWPDCNQAFDHETLIDHCPSCSHVTFCDYCGKKDHTSDACPLIGEEEVKLDGIERTIKPCPKCKTPIDYYEGCVHIKCVCKHEFCWVCGKQWESYGKPCGGTCTRVRRFATREEYEETQRLLREVQ